MPFPIYKMCLFIRPHSCLYSQFILIAHPLNIPPSSLGNPRYKPFRHDLLLWRTSAELHEYHEIHKHDVLNPPLEPAQSVV